jgi:hypothetical protein
MVDKKTTLSGLINRKLEKLKILKKKALFGLNAIENREGLF